MLCVKNLCKTYHNYRNSDDLHVLQDINLTANAGEFISIIGPSGCGKSTIFNILCGIEEKTSGEVTIDGRPAATGAFAYMPQRDLLMPWKRVWENIAIPLRLAGRSKKEARGVVEEQISRYGLQDFLDAWPSELSGGMRQRAALFRTILTGGDIMLLDEPFAALDALNRERMQEWLL